LRLGDRVLTDGHKYLKPLLGLDFSLIEDFAHSNVERLAESDLETQKKKMCPSVRIAFLISIANKITFLKCDKIGVADLDYEFSIDLFEKSNLKLIFGYVQNHHSYLDSATPQNKL
jgi:hypothetical protein